jgi:hypothetical protein
MQGFEDEEGNMDKDLKGSSLVALNQTQDKYSLIYFFIQKD